MKKKSNKTLAKLQPRKLSKMRSGLHGLLRRSTVISCPICIQPSIVTPVHKAEPVCRLRCLFMLWTSLLLTGCAGLSDQVSGKVSFANPPTVGTLLQPQRALMACKTKAAARYMSDFGFGHPLCKPLSSTGQQAHIVKGREMVQLPEGPMWLLRVTEQEQTYFVPIPWHDWF